MSKRNIRVLLVVMVAAIWISVGMQFIPEDEAMPAKELAVREKESDEPVEQVIPDTLMLNYPNPFQLNIAPKKARQSVKATKKRSSKPKPRKVIAWPDIAVSGVFSKNKKDFVYLTLNETPHVVQVGRSVDDTIFVTMACADSVEFKIHRERKVVRL